MATCRTCNTTIVTSRDYRLVTGYERIHRPSGGTNMLKLRRTGDEYKCATCIANEGRGISPDQEALL